MGSKRQDFLSGNNLYNRVEFSSISIWLPLTFLNLQLPSEEPKQMWLILTELARFRKVIFGYLYLDIILHIWTQTQGIGHMGICVFFSGSIN